MAFKVKDLMIQVLPRDQGVHIRYRCVEPTNGGCIEPTYCPGGTGCPWGTGPILRYCYPVYSLDRYIPIPGCFVPHSLDCVLPTFRCFISPRPWIDPGGQVVDPVSVRLLRDQLKEALKNLENVEARVDEMFKPQTIEEVNMLEKGMKEGLQELAKIKASLVRKSGK